MQPKLGIGSVRHRRNSPNPDAVEHAFSYPLFMPLLDLDRVAETLSASPWWSAEKRNIASHRRADYLGDAQQPLKQAVLDEVETQLGFRPNGQVLQLAHARYFGHNFNPIALYFCFDQDQQLQACLAEVNNIPWREKTCYAMPVNNETSRRDRWTWTHRNDKNLHVSPFMPMDMEYRWRVKLSDNRLVVHIENWQQLEDSKREQKQFDATLQLELHDITPQQLRSVLWRYPAMTAKVVGAIHWQALKLWLKGVPYIPKPNTPKPNKRQQASH